MNGMLIEHFTLMVSIVKWAVYASFTGIVVGISTAFFLKVLDLSTGALAALPHFIFLIPVFLILAAYLVGHFAPEARGHGTEKVIEAVHERMGRIPFNVVPVKLVATVITLACGGSAGKEGPCAQIGAGLASAFADLFKINDQDRQRLVICGISAGFATVFGTPIAGALFGVEVLFLGQLLYDVLFPAFVSGMVGFHVAKALGVNYFHYPIRFLPQYGDWLLIQAILLGLFCGAIAFFLIEALELGENGFERLKWTRENKALLGGLLLIAIGVLVSPQYLGLGTDFMEAGLTAGVVLPYGAFFWKTLATSVTLACGGSGGIITPVFFIGTAAGNLFGAMFAPDNIAVFSAMGMVSMLAGAANTPISASIMAIELFGPDLAPFAAMSCVVSYLFVGHHSVYPSQILSIRKSASLLVDMGKPLGEVDIRAYPRRGTWFRKLLLWLYKKR